MKTQIKTERGGMDALLGAMGGKGVKVSMEEAARNERRRELLELSKPLIKWLNRNWNPHTRIVIDTTGAEVVSGEMSIVIDEYVED